MFLYAQEVCTDFMLLKNTFEKDKEVALKAKSFFFLRQVHRERKPSCVMTSCLPLFGNLSPCNAFKCLQFNLG